MKTQTVCCGECGRPYDKPDYSLDLNIGDKVIFESWVGGGCCDHPITITDITYKKEGLYFGWRTDVVWPDEIHDNVRVDTKKDEYVNCKDLCRLCHGYGLILREYDFRKILCKTCHLNEANGGECNTAIYYQTRCGFGNCSLCNGKCYNDGRMKKRLML
jgi:hypothetical protein